MVSRRLAGLFVGLMFGLCFLLSGPVPATAANGTHLYVLMGLGNNSPGLAEFGSRMAARGIPTTVDNHGNWPALAARAVQEARSGQLHTVLIVGHSLGGAAALDMAGTLGRAGIPVQLVVMIDPVMQGGVPRNVRRVVDIRPRGNEDHFSVIVAREREITGYVLGSVH